MKYTDWKNYDHLTSHYAVGDQFDWFMAKAFNDCIRGKMPLPQEVCDWWWDKHNEATKNETSFANAMKWRRAYGLENWHAIDWNSYGGIYQWQSRPWESQWLRDNPERMDRWRTERMKRGLSTTATPGPVITERFDTSNPGDAGTVVLEVKVPRSKLTGTNPRISVQVTSGK